MLKLSDRDCKAVIVKILQQAIINMFKRNKIQKVSARKQKM